MRRCSPTRAAKAEPMKPPAPVTSDLRGDGSRGFQGPETKRASREMPVCARLALRYGQLIGVAVMVMGTIVEPSVTFTVPLAG